MERARSRAKLVNTGSGLTRSKTAIFEKKDLAAAAAGLEDSDEGVLRRVPRLEAAGAIGGTSRDLGGTRRGTRMQDEGGAVPGLRSAASLQRMQHLIAKAGGSGTSKRKHKKHRHKHGHGHTRKKKHRKKSKGKGHHGHHGHHGRHPPQAAADHRSLSAAAREVMRKGAAMRALRGGGRPGAPAAASRDELLRPLRRGSLVNAPRAPPASARLRASRLSRSARSIFDLDGTGEISAANVASVAHRVQRSERDAATLRRRLWLAVVAALLLAACVLGLVVWGAEIVKETKISGEGGAAEGAASAAFTVVNDGNATRVAATARAEVAAPLALAALLPAEVLARVQHVDRESHKLHTAIAIAIVT